MIHNFIRDMQLVTVCGVENWNVSMEQFSSPIYDITCNTPIDFIRRIPITKYSVELLCQQNYDTLIEKIEHVAFFNGLYLNNIKITHNECTRNFVINLCECSPQITGVLMGRRIAASHNFVKTDSKCDSPTNRIFQFRCICKECGMHGSMCSTDNLQVYADINMSCNDYIMKEVLQ